MALWLLPWMAQGAAATQPITVFAAASLTEVLQELGDQYTKAGGPKIEFSFGATSTLARQIEAGAHADVFFSADPEWMDYLAQRALIRIATRRNMLANRLALIAPASSTVQLQIKPGLALRAALGNGRLATGDPDSVPVGRYARAALTHLGVWGEVADRLVRADNVRSALAFVARGEAPLGIVYATDARADSRVRIVDLFPDNSHPAIQYPIALTADAGAGSAAFVGFLASPGGAAVFKKYGFAVLN